MKHLWGRFPKDNRIGLKRLCSNNTFAFITYKSANQYFDSCPIMKIKERLFTTSTSMGVPFNSTFLRHFKET